MHPNNKPQTAESNGNAQTQTICGAIVIANLVMQKSDWSFFGYKMVNPLFLGNTGYIPEAGYYTAWGRTWVNLHVLQAH